MSADRSTLLRYAAGMRRAPTEAERRLWWRIRNSQLGGHKFRRQATIADRIVDFLCPTKGLVVEVDGETHDPARDAGRDADLSARFGFTILRFINHEVMDNLDGVLETILSTLDGLPDRWIAGTTPNPSSEEEGSKI